MLESDPPASVRGAASGGTPAGLPAGRHDGSRSGGRSCSEFSHPPLPSNSCLMVFMLLSTTGNLQLLKYDHVLSLSDMILYCVIM